MPAQSRLALVEIDLQEWVVAIGHRDIRVAAGAARRRARSAGALVICSRYLDPDPASVRADPNGEAARFVTGLQPEPGDLVLTKHGRDLTANPDLDANLRVNGVTDVLLTGVATDHGVTLAARGLAQLGYRVTVVEDACAATSAAAHEVTLAALDTDTLRWSALQDVPSLI